MTAHRDGRPRSVTAFVAGAFGLAVTLLMIFGWLQTPRIPWASWQMVSCYLFVALLLVGELRPLVVARSDGDTDRVTVSTTFAVTLVVIGPVCLAMAAQVASVAIDDLWRRRQPFRAAFNVGQYALTVAAARLIYSLASGHPFLQPVSDFGPRDLLPSLLAGTTYLVVNNGAVAVIVALDSGLRVLSLLREDLRIQGITSAILIGLAPVAAVVANFFLPMVPLLVLPLVGVQHNAWIAARRQHDALHDGLTGLPNRELFRRRAERALAMCRGSGKRLAVMLVDLDHFKEVNDTLGHHVGDELLREVAQRVIGALPEGVTLARLGGDEFAILLPGVDDLETMTSLAQQITTYLTEPAIADGVRIAVQASIGIAAYPDHGVTIDELLQRADIALYQAKENRGDVQVYRPEIDQHTVTRLNLLADLHSATKSGEFQLVYQPQVDASDGSVVAVEALLRWHHPSRGVISPDEFIPLAENTGAISAISRQVMEMALTDLALLHSTQHDLSMSVNVSPRLLSDLALATWLRSLLAATSIPPSLLTIEVTESTIASDPTRAMQVLQDLREAGVRVAIDDFGTGYSSMSQLGQLQPDEIKVDKSFVMQMSTDETSAAIVRSTIDLGHGLGVWVVAEGVENRETYTALADLGCDRLQGYHIARPMPLPALLIWLASWRQPTQASRKAGRRVPA